MKKIALFLFIPIIALSACKPNGGNLTINASKVSTELSANVETFKCSGFKFEYLGVKNDGNNNFVFGVDNSYIQSVNGKPDHLMRFKTPNTTGDFVVYGINDSDTPVLLEKYHHSQETRESSYVISGYDNFRIEYRMRPGESRFEPVNIGTLFFWC